MVIIITIHIKLAYHLLLILYGIGNIPNMQINTEMTMLITHVINMQEVECLKTYFLLSFLQQNTVRNAVYNKQPA